MPVIYISRKDLLGNRKFALLRHLAEHDLASAIAAPPPPGLPSREKILQGLAEVEAGFDALGTDQKDRDVWEMAEAVWESQDAG